MGVKLKFQSHTKFCMFFFLSKYLSSKIKIKMKIAKGDFEQVEQSLNNICFGRLHTSFMKHFCRQNGSV